MSVRVPPRGTRGTGFGNFPRWIVPIFSTMNVMFFRMAGSRAKVQGRPLLLLETTGARSGRPRRTTLGWFPDEGGPARSWLIVASNAGAAAHPNWFFNLARRPEAVIDVGGERVRVSAETLQGEERRRAWERVVALAPGYGKYGVETDREIPIVRLVPRT